MKNDPRTEVFIAEFINTRESNNPDAGWAKLWGMLIGCTLTLSESKSSEKAKKVIKVHDVEIQPAVKETGKLLAFKLVDKGKALIILEPLNITGMGRWISSLFAAIQGVEKYEIKENQIEKSYEEQTFEGMKEERFMVDAQRHKVSEPDDINYSVKVKDLAKIFENLSSGTESRRATVRRSVSSPNLAAKSTTTVKKTFAAEEPNIKIQEKNGLETKILTRQHSQKLPSPSSPVANQSQSNKVINYKGNYIAQETERSLLSNLMNPQLAKQRLVKQQQLIQRLEVTMKSVIEKVKRQKKTLEETEIAIKDLESLSTTPEDLIDITKLQEQKRKLERNIAQSETDIEEYKGLIAKAREESMQLIHVIGENEKTPFAVKVEPSITNKTVNKYVVTANIQLTENQGAPIHVQNGHSNGQQQPAIVSKPLPEKDTYVQDEPEWISKARRKSEAIKKLTEKGLID